MNIPIGSLQSPIIRIFLEGYLEILISSIITFTAITRHNYRNTYL
jgi:hypothetical protein